jgi:hypothetical protein
MTTPAAFKPLSRNDVADILGVTVRTIENHIASGVLPAPAAIGNRRYWHLDVFYAWLELALCEGGGSSSDVEPAQPAGLKETRPAAGPTPLSVAPGPKPARGRDKGAAVERARARDQALLRELEGV